MTEKKRKRWKIILALLAILIILGLIAARLYLPIYLRDYINKQLANLNGYHGHVENIDVSLIRGAYVIHDLTIVKTNSGIPVPFLRIKTTDLSLQWGALIRGRIVSDIQLDRAEINFAVNKSGTVKQTGTEPDWNAAIKKLMPIDINTVTLTNSKIAYRDFSTHPEVNIFMSDMSGEIRNLRNVEDKSKALPSPFYGRGTSIGGGKMELKGNVNILTKYVDMDGSAKLEGVDVKALNTYSMAYASIDFEGGDFNAYSELVIKDGNVRGYLKPIANHLRIIDNRRKDKNLLEKIWEPIAAAVVQIFSNQEKDQFATIVPFEGKITSVETPFWPQVTAILRNAFVQAFHHGIGNDIKFSDPSTAPVEAESTSTSSSSSPLPKREKIRHAH